MMPLSRAVRFILFSLAVALSGSLGACEAPWRDTYFKKGVDRLTHEAVRERFGPPPTKKPPALGGDSLWTYRFAMSENELDPLDTRFLADASQSAMAIMGKGGEVSKPTLYCYRYLLTFNEEKVLNSWKREECVPGTREALTAK